MTLARQQRSAAAKQHRKDNVNGDGSETDMIMQLLQQHQLRAGAFSFWAISDCRQSPGVQK